MRVLQAVADLTARAQRSGVDVRFRWAAAAPVGVGPTAGSDSTALRLRRRYPAALIGEVDGWAVILSAAPLDDLPPGSGTAGTAGAGGAGAGLRRAIGGAAVAAHLGVSSMDGVAAAPFRALLSLDPADRDDFVRSTLGPLGRTPTDDDLTATLVCYLGAGRRRSAMARLLHVHRHTLDRRLAQIDQLLPVELDDPSERLRVELALFLLGRHPTGAQPK
ncbi:helix-turn-helix domain-containing protein [Cryptosporangium phraense]|uniref:PucR family transcriptional regulator n=1 Tax=Cryptosporangium phraense TaxID=2593070 RepID=A0A545AHX4_9ACTN|nr:helix-turn-helix domain-containing protein [Cryptosporangium phraense]TQS40921.1 PucR family transcriptional regulator [Cryptosporangium phraense]